MTHQITVAEDGTCFVDGKPGDFESACDQFAVEAATSGEPTLVYYSTPQGTQPLFVDAEGRRTLASNDLGSVHLQPIYLTVAEVASHYRVSTATISQLIRSRRMPGVRMSDGWYVPCSVLAVPLISGENSADETR